MLEALQAMGSVVLDLHLLLLIFATTIIGVIIGVLPGLGATTGAALLLPFTLTMTPVHAITVLATIYVSATFAGSITAILINTPGTSAAAATTFDGFPLAQRGEAGRALGVAVVSSTVGGVFSVIILVAGCSITHRHFQAGKPTLHPKFRRLSQLLPLKKGKPEGGINWNTFTRSAQQSPHGFLANFPLNVPKSDINGSNGMCRIPSLSTR